MSENKKERINDVALRLSNYKLSNIDSGSYDYLLTLDMDSLIERFNNGDYDVLNSEEINMFLNINIQSIDVINYILNAKALLEMKSDFYSDVEQQQDGMVYDSNRTYYNQRYSYGRKNLTYAQIDMMFRLADRIVNSNRIYAILKFLLKYENLKESIKVRQRLFAIMKKNPDGIEKLHSVLNQYDPNVGIIKIVEDDTVTVTVGTKHDMEISNLIGKPFPADCDEPGYDHPYANYYRNSHKITKEFYENGTTPNHQKMIEAEKSYRARLSQSKIDEVGFIIAGNKAIIISSLELTKLGIDPQSVGWVPLKLTISPKSLFKVCKENDSTRYLSFGAKVQLKKDIILSKRR